MSAPKHLWAGDWESESAARSRPPAEGSPAPAPRDPPPRPAQDPVPRSNLRWTRPALLGTAVALLVLAGGVYAAKSLQGTGSPESTRAPWLGLRLASSSGGVLVADVVPGSPADAAGLRRGDVIVEVQNRPVVTPVNVTEAIAVLSPGDVLQVRFLRGHRTYTTNARLVAPPARASSP